MWFNRALDDLGASINLMPLSIFEKLSLGEFKNTHVKLQLADRSLVRPKGVLKDVSIKVHNFIISLDFVVLDFEEDWEILILLGRPFLDISQSTIDLDTNELTMKINGEVKTFKGGNQTDEDHERKEQCNELFFIGNHKRRDTLPFMYVERKNRFKERDK